MITTKQIKKDAKEAKELIKEAQFLINTIINFYMGDDQWQRISKDCDNLVRSIDHKLGSYYKTISP